MGEIERYYMYNNRSLVRRRIKFKQSRRVQGTL